MSRRGSAVSGVLRGARSFGVLMSLGTPTLSPSWGCPSFGCSARVASALVAALHAGLGLSPELQRGVCHLGWCCLVAACCGPRARSTVPPAAFRVDTPLWAFLGRSSLSSKYLGMGCCWLALPWSDRRVITLSCLPYLISGCHLSSFSSSLSLTRAASLSSTSHFTPRRCLPALAS